MYSRKYISQTTCISCMAKKYLGKNMVVASSSTDGLSIVETRKSTFSFTHFPVIFLKHVCPFLPSQFGQQRLEHHRPPEGPAQPRHVPLGGKRVLVLEKQALQEGLRNTGPSEHLKVICFRQYLVSPAYTAAVGGMLVLRTIVSL